MSKKRKRPKKDVIISFSVITFKFQERYSHHKKKALHWLEMKYKYTDARIVMMANSLNHPSFSFNIIKSDIFQNELKVCVSANLEKIC